MSSIEQTAVTGAPLSKLVPKRGQKIAGRYVVNDRLYRDPFSTGFLGRDEETDTTVLVRIARVELLDRDAREVTCAKLQEAIGIGGRYFSPLLDADLDGPFVFTVEHVPSGASLRRVLKLRKKTQRRLRPRELLPVIARLSAALVAIPPPFCHGDVRAENIWIDPERLMLTGGFLVSSLPKEVISSVVTSDDRFRARFAPELARGAANDSSDRYSVASIAYEALVGELVDPDAARVPARLGAVADYLDDLLRRDSHRRARSLDPLIKAIAAQAGLPVPDLDAGAFRTARKPRKPRSEPAATVPAATIDDDEPASADVSDRASDELASEPSGESKPPESRDQDSIDTLVLSDAEKIRDAVRAPRRVARTEETVPDGSREELTSLLGKLEREPTPDSEGTTRIDMEELAAERARREADRDEEGTVRVDREAIEAERERRGKESASRPLATIDGADQAGTQQISFDELQRMTERSRRSDAPPRPTVEGAAEEGTQQVRLEDLRAMAVDRQDAANLDTPSIDEAALDEALDDAIDDLPAVATKLGRVIEGAAQGGTQELSVDDFEQMLLDKRESTDATNKSTTTHTAPTRKLQAPAESRKRRGSDGSLDPRFVRAALATIDEPEVPPDPTDVESEEVPAPLDLPPPYDPDRENAVLRPELAAIARAVDTAKAMDLDAPDEDDSPTQIRAIDEIKPVPRPRLDPSAPLRTGVDAEVLFDDSAIELTRPELPPTVEIPLDDPEPAPATATPPAATAASEAPAKPRRAAERSRELGDTFDDEVGRRAAATRRGRLGWKIILFAILLGMTIVGGALIYVQAKRSAAERESIRQQYQQQQQTGTTAP